jgi:hypothetical protein
MGAGSVFVVHTEYRKEKLAIRAVDFAERHIYMYKGNPLNIPPPVDACIGSLLHCEPVGSIIILSPGSRSVNPENGSIDPDPKKIVMDL